MTDEETITTRSKAKVKVEDERVEKQEMGQHEQEQEEDREEEKKDDAPKKDYSNWPLKGIREPHPHDVMFGRGGKVSSCVVRRA